MEGRKIRDKELKNGHKWALDGIWRGKRLRMTTRISVFHNLKCCLLGGHSAAFCVRNSLYQKHSSLQMADIQRVSKHKKFPNLRVSECILGFVQIFGVQKKYQDCF